MDEVKFISCLTARCSSAAAAIHQTQQSKRASERLLGLSMVPRPAAIAWNHCRENRATAAAASARLGTASVGTAAAPHTQPTPNSQDSASCLLRRLRPTPWPCGGACACLVQPQQGRPQRGRAPGDARCRCRQGRCQYCCCRLAPRAAPGTLGRHPCGLDPRSRRHGCLPRSQHQRRPIPRSLVNAATQIQCRLQRWWRAVVCRRRCRRTTTLRPRRVQRRKPGLRHPHPWVTATLR